MDEAAYEMNRMLMRLLGSAPTIVVIALLLVGFFFLGRWSAEHHLKKHYANKISDGMIDKMKVDIHSLETEVEELIKYKMQILHIRGVLK